MLITESEFWQQSLELYADKANQQALLSQQDKYALNVNLALLCQCFDQKNITLSQTLIIALHDDIAEFSQTYTSALREIRKRVKQDLSQSMPTEGLRQQLLKTELEFEKLEQQTLVTALAAKSAELSDDLTPTNYLRYVNHCQNLI